LINRCVTRRGPETSTAASSQQPLRDLDSHSPKQHSRPTTAGNNHSQWLEPRSKSSLNMQTKARNSLQQDDIYHSHRSSRSSQTISPIPTLIATANAEYWDTRKKGCMYKNCELLGKKPQITRTRYNLLLLDEVLQTSSPSSSPSLSEPAHSLAKRKRLILKKTRQGPLFSLYYDSILANARQLSAGQSPREASRKQVIRYDCWRGSRPELPP
jgi:hypothetical protein